VKAAKEINILTTQGNIKGQEGKKNVAREELD
jgi:hypothetical protein